MVDGLALLRQRLDQAYKAFRSNPTEENRQKLDQAIAAYEQGA